MKKVVSMLLVLGIFCSFLMGVSAAGSVLYVSPAGNDSNAGTKDAPLASLAKACELAEDGTTIYLMEGAYKMKETAVIEGKKDLTIRNQNGAKVTLAATNGIDSGHVKKVTDQAILDRIITKAARENLYVIDMKSAGITEYGAVSMRGMGYPAVPGDPQLLIDGKAQTLARYPDDDYLLTEEIIEPGVSPADQEDKVLLNYKGKGFTIRSNDARISKWKEAKDPYLFGYFIYDWAEAALACTIQFDNKNAISTEYPSYYGLVRNRRFYFFNLLEEISQPGEWYLDRETGMLYIYLNGELKSKPMDFVTFSAPFITVSDSENITIQGLNLQNGLDKGMMIENSEKVTVSDCNFDQVSAFAVEMKQCTDSHVTYCNFTNLGAGGVFMDCGNRETLVPGNCSVTNCEFKNIQLVTVNGNHAVTLRGVGNRIAHNVISETKGVAIRYDGNDCIIEYNELYNVCTDTSDMGAIYSGRNWTTRGNIVRYNYVHDMKMISSNNTGMKICGVYLDDCHSSTKVYGNVFYNIEQIALFGGGRNNTFENNIMIDCSQPFRLDSRGLGWMATNDSMNTMYSNLEAMPYQSGIWAEKYPELGNILEDEPGSPKYNVIQNNVQYQSAGYHIDQVALDHGTFENNIEINNKKNFVDFANKNFNLAEDSEVFKKLPDFEPIPFDEIGIQEKPAEKTANTVLEGAVVLKLDTSKTYVFGAESMIDPANSAVVPFTKDDRTLVPVRFIAESFGGEVTWEEATQKVGITCGDFVIELQLGNREMTVNGETIVLDVPAQAVNDRTVLPLRAVVEALGKTVFWDDRGLIVISDGEILNAEDADLVTSIVNLF